MAFPHITEVLLHPLLGFFAFFSFVYLHQAKRPYPSWFLRLTSTLINPNRQHADIPCQDEIEYPPPRPPQKDILGGAGSYSALGARLFSPAPVQSKTVGWLVDQGSDFPPAITSLIDSWETSALLRLDPDRLTTRGWNGYIDDKETRAFRYTTPRKRITAADLRGTALLQSRSFHMVCSPARCRELVTEIVALRKKEAPPEDAEGGGGYTRPIFIWEPVPDLCTPDELLNLTNCLPLIDVCSPNHGELAGFMGDTGVDPVTGEISTASVERACEQLLGSMPLSSFTLVVRAGEKGCYIARNGGRRKSSAGRDKSGTDAAAGRQRRKQVGHHGGLQPDTDMMSLFAGLLQQSGEEEDEEAEDGTAAAAATTKTTYSFIREEDNEVEIDPGLDRWIPAYWTKENVHQVVDPTGGGNTFLGGLAVALARGKSMEEAVCWGSIAASFAIQQVGVPELGRDGEGEETWNGERVWDRLKNLQERIGWSAEAEPTQEN